MRIEARKLTHRFPGTANLFENLSFNLESGEMVALTGPSGCGKSTLLGILAGWEKPISGEVVTEGSGKISWVFQNPLGSPKRTVLDHVALPFLARGLTRAEANLRAGELLERFYLENQASQPYATLSGGQATRLMLARAFATQPGLLLVDEPTAQLDTHTAASVNQVLGALASKNIIVVVATHDGDTAAACGRQINLKEYAP
ncbi:MAG: ATP-binding cassette domain-containing protein [Mobiluncus porci]|uniref:ATP-binding cassette domain-containing protein n=1 Tax=Mobiluncus porci TaxID=2652278 RepID=UPI0023F4B87F|nr:ATP-binding cassette domain-containing protein [Mobiluncus porci]MDD7542068.1 ATP-binding cassette domain-containing protein [Mobiluncus porci]MDY5749411.1 ATP-binding cassette domain-containing protein [Mobiluncus porci]